MSLLIGFLVALGLPIFASLAAAALLGYWRAGVDPLLLGMDFTRVVTLPELAALPLFIFAGLLVLSSRARVQPGGMTSSADHEFPELAATPVGLTAPSLPLIVYALVACQLAPRFQIQLVELYQQALVPLGLVVLMIAGLAWFGYQPLGLTLRSRQLTRELRQWTWDWPLLPIVVGGLYLGWLPVVDAAVVAVVWLLMTRVALQRKLAFSAVLKLIVDAMAKTAGLCLLLGLSIAVAGVMNDAGIAQYGFGWPDATVRGLVSLLFVASLLVLVGTVLDVLTGMILLAPIVILLALGNASLIDPSALGVLCVLGLQLGRSLVHGPKKISPVTLESAAETEFAIAHWSITLAAMLAWLAWLIAIGP